jgi:hypothetical protein
MRASICAGLAAITLLGGLGACGSSGSSSSSHSDPTVSGAAAAVSGAGGSDDSGGSSSKAGSAGSQHGGAGGGSQGGSGGTALGCEAPRCIELCEGGDCTCSCEGTAGSAAMAGASGSSCATLNTARAQSLQLATSCSPELDGQCAMVITVPNQCACDTVVNSARPEAVQAAQQAYDAWTLAGCGPYACGAACPKGTAATCQAPNAGSGTCTWSL